MNYFNVHSLNSFSNLVEIMLCVEICSLKQGHLLNPGVHLLNLVKAASCFFLSLGLFVCEAHKNLLKTNPKIFGQDWDKLPIDYFLSFTR